jgi:hypothetical protein
MSNNHRLPIDESILNAFWNEVVSGSETDHTLASQLPADVVRTIRSITAIDPAPQSSTVRERAWAETRERIRTTSAAHEQPSVQAMPRPLPVSERAREAPSTGRIDRRLAVAFSLIAAMVLALLAYGFFGLFDSDPDNGPVIPAVVMQEVTRTPTPIGEHKLTIDLPADRVHSTGSTGAGWDYIEFPRGIPYLYKGYCCPGPFIEYVLTGQITVQSDAQMSIFRADGSSKSIPIGQETTLLAGDAFLAENDAQLQVTNNGEVLTQLLGWVLLNEDGFNGHSPGGFPSSLDVDLESDMTVNPGPGQLVITRYDRLDQIPDRAPNSYQFVLQAYHDSAGAAKVMSSLVEMPATPSAGGYDGFYVLDFLMSPPGTPSPTAGTPVN